MTKYKNFDIRKITVTHRDRKQSGYVASRGHLGNVVPQWAWFTTKAFVENAIDALIDSECTIPKAIWGENGDIEVTYPAENLKRFWTLMWDREIPFRFKGGVGNDPFGVFKKITKTGHTPRRAAGGLPDWAHSCPMDVSVRQSNEHAARINGGNLRSSRSLWAPYVFLNEYALNPRAARYLAESLSRAADDCEKLEIEMGWHPEFEAGGKTAYDRLLEDPLSEESD